MVSYIRSFLIDYELNIDLNMLNIGNGNINESMNLFYNLFYPIGNRHVKSRKQNDPACNETMKIVVIINIFMKPSTNENQ